MRSHGRNSRNPLLAPCAATAVSVLLGATALAAESQHDFVLTAYSNGRGGPELISGDFAAATKVLSHVAPTFALQTSTTSNNRCVALAVTKQWDAARAACDQAVRDAQLDKINLPSYQYSARRNQDEYLAIALSNRAVLHWMSSESEAAASDLKRAQALSPSSASVMQNAQALEQSRTSLARVDVAPASP
jgi:hypothetical protein